MCHESSWKIYSEEGRGLARGRGKMGALGEGHENQVNNVIHMKMWVSLYDNQRLSSKKVAKEKRQQKARNWAGES